MPHPTRLRIVDVTRGHRVAGVVLVLVAALLCAAAMLACAAMVGGCGGAQGLDVDPAKVPLTYYVRVRPEPGGTLDVASGFAIVCEGTWADLECSGDLGIGATVSTGLTTQLPYIGTVAVKSRLSAGVDAAAGFAAELAVCIVVLGREPCIIEREWGGDASP